MIKYIISEEEKRRILNLHEGFKNNILNEQTPDPTTGTPASGGTVNNDTSKVTPREDKSQKALEWGKGDVKGVVNSKQYSVTMMNMPPSPGEKPVTFNMYTPTIRKSSSRNGSWLGYTMWIYDVKSKKMMDSLSIDCNSVDRCLKSSGWVQIDAFNKSEYKWYFNKEFLQDLKTTLGCK